MDTSWCCQERTISSGIKAFPGWGETSFTVTTRRALDRNMLVTVLRAGSRGATHWFNYTEITRRKADLGPSIISATVKARWQQCSRGGGWTSDWRHWPGQFDLSSTSHPQSHCSEKCLSWNFTGSGFCSWLHLECLESVTKQLSNWEETTIPELDCTWIFERSSV